MLSPLLSLLKVFLRRILTVFCGTSFYSKLCRRSFYQHENFKVLLPRNLTIVAVTLSSLVLELKLGDGKAQ